MIVRDCGGSRRLAGLLSGVAGVARAESSALAPIDPFCHPAGLSQCVFVEIDPGIYLPEGESDDRGIQLPEWPWNGAIEVGYTESAVVCEPEMISRAPAPGCIDLSELSRIDPRIELPGDRR